MLSGSNSPNLVQELAQSEGVPSDQRLNIHHNNFRETLAGSLSGVFPALEAFVGAVFVKGALSEFCVAYPPKDASLLGYGSDFATFLDNHKASEQVPYAADLVRLEWAIHELQLVDEVVATEPSQNEWQLNPNARVIRSEFPLLSLWSVANGQLPPEAVHIEQGGQNVIVLLNDGEVSLLALTDQESHVLDELAAQRSVHEISSTVLSSVSKKKIIVPA
ncbi:MAG: putative DNA-binding domain-containing protein [Kordiimonadaceae bacterium]|nr:putative DNA-binding domain-containing protein [Kordiimonadaceae bacterium]MBO6570691.1 putative DNA-binding domain-containing protein [Kordiimonadaceae bacterium]MBO6966451.1 putative DNA-binding domain-containing protein [Kordiimonadaceae bacterium]